MGPIQIVDEQSRDIPAIESAPHHPIPISSTLVTGGVSSLFPLGILGVGEKAEIVSMRDEPEPLRDCRVEDMGLRAGKIVQMLTNGGGGPILLKVDETRLAIGLRMAMKIQVRRLR